MPSPPTHLGHCLTRQDKAERSESKGRTPVLPFLLPRQHLSAIGSGADKLFPRKSLQGGITGTRDSISPQTQLWCGFEPDFAGREAYAENRLFAVTIIATGHRSEFGYDGLGRRVEIIEKDPDANQTLQVTSDKKYLWDGVEIAEERDATGGIVQKQFYSQGFVDTDGTIPFYTRDHLGSIRELTDGTQAVRAR